jgi:hypothetical protein
MVSGTQVPGTPKLPKMTFDDFGVLSPSERHFFIRPARTPAIPYRSNPSQKEKKNNMAFTASTQNTFPIVARIRKGGPKGEKTIRKDLNDRFRFAFYHDAGDV